MADNKAKEFDQLGTIIFDHYKDANMMYEYAVTAKSDSNAELAQYYIKGAKERLSQIKPAHDPIKKLMGDKKDMHEGYHTAVHKCMIKQVEELEKKLAEFDKN